MVKKTRNTQRREDSLSRDRIIEVAIELLDSVGEDGLTFRALAERLATGPGALYWHIANKSDLLTAACDAIVARMMKASLTETPETAIRSLALGMFDAIAAHPWVGSALSQSPGQLPVVRIVEGIAGQVRALGVPDDNLWSTVSALVTYIVGVGGWNAAHGQLAKTRGLDRSDYLKTVSAMWSQLDPDQYPMARSLAGRMRAHDDRADFLAGVDLILSGIRSSRSR